MRQFGGWLWVAVLSLLLTAPQPVLAAGPRPLERLTVTADSHPLRVSARRAARPKGAVLFVHRRTWSARPNFDLTTPSGSMSILQAFADQGYAAYAIDLRGYGETPRDATGWLGGLPTTQVGDINLLIPKLRAGSFLPSILEPRRRVDQARYAVITEAYINGVSTRKVDALVAALGSQSGISKSQVSR